MQERSNMATFEKSIENILKHEGGYVNDKDDPGKETRYGISKRQYPNIDIKTLNIEQAKEIYKKDYWYKMKLDEVFNDEVAEKIFDIGVNMGVSQAGKIVQEACNLLDDCLKVDGLIGSKTIYAINKINHQKALLKLIIYLRVVKYFKIIERNPVLKKFLNGWLIRA